MIWRREASERTFSLRDVSIGFCNTSTSAPAGSWFTNHLNPLFERDVRVEGHDSTHQCDGGFMLKIPFLQSRNEPGRVDSSNSSRTPLFSPHCSTASLPRTARDRRAKTVLTLGTSSLEANSWPCGQSPFHMRSHKLRQQESKSHRAVVTAPKFRRAENSIGAHK